MSGTLSKKWIQQIFRYYVRKDEVLVVVDCDNDDGVVIDIVVDDDDDIREWKQHKNRYSTCLQVQTFSSLIKYSCVYTDVHVTIAEGYFSQC